MVPTSLLVCILFFSESILTTLHTPDNLYDVAKECLGHFFMCADSGKNKCSVT
jgi:hypothetical protein